MNRVIVLCLEEHIENNCTLCIHFDSYAEHYFDNLEPVDMGFCQKGMNDSCGNATLTCEKFENLNTARN